MQGTRRKKMPKVPNARWRETAAGPRIQVSYYQGGKRHQPWAPAGYTLTQARKWAAALALAEAPLPATDDNLGVLVAEVCQEWLNWFKPTCRSKNTWDRYVNDVRRLLPLLGDRPIAALTSTDVEQARNQLLEGTWQLSNASGAAHGSDKSRGFSTRRGRQFARVAAVRAIPGGRNAESPTTRRDSLSASTVQNTLRLFQTICAWAMDEDRGYLTKNPVTKALKGGHRGAASLDYVPLATAEAARLMSCILRHATPDDPWCPAAVMLGLGLATGLRLESEWGGAQWGDIDWQRGVFTLQRSWDTRHREVIRRRNGKLHQRSITLQPQSLALLRAQWDWQVAQHGAEPEPAEFVFLDWRGEPVAVSTIAQVLDRCVWEAGLGREAGQRLSPHSLRHQAAIEALRAGVNIKAVQDMLGHSTISMTVDRYCAYVPGLEQTATAALSSALFGPSKTKEAV